jgi:hypothetical protein
VELLFARIFLILLIYREAETEGFPASVGGVAVLAPLARIGHPSLGFFFHFPLLIVIIYLLFFIADSEKDPSDDTVNFVKIVRSFRIQLGLFYFRHFFSLSE